ncbi:hypothetical protein [Flavobacterium sp. RSSB_23]|jgi:hypothetical protein|uniref:hypothetical protein n=1 Tax=Flavobacterium sp. RSSB_23 TaxID=3447668 RepID=UPI003F40516F
MKNKFIAILLILANLSFGQNQDNQKLKLKTESDNWIQSLEKIDSKEKQIHFIIEKIKRDSIIEFKNSSDRIVIKPNEGENLNDAINRQSKCKILFVLTQKKVGYLLDLNEYPKYSIILKYLTDKTINSIEILKGGKATSLYGSRAICGVIVLKSDDKKLRKLIEKSLRKEKPNA